MVAHIRPAIEVQNLSRHFVAQANTVVALDNINFTVEESEFIAIVGPSGCGKTTLLNIFAGLLKASSGTARLRGEPIMGPRRDVGVVFQSPVLFPWRTVLENVLLPIDVQRRRRSDFEPSARTLLKIAKLEGFENNYPYELSGGMQQRVGLVRALIHEPAMLLMDEPFGALDALTREIMNVELQRIWLERPRTVIFITHSISEAVFLADRVLVMTPRPGKVRLDLKIDFPRPRTLQVMREQKFADYAHEIRECLDAHGGID
jgi:NitT/TauT family transport system ATP-binding protein